MTTALSWLDDFFGPAVPRFEDTDLPKRPTVEYTGDGVTVTDDTVNNRTIVDIAAGGGDGPITGDSVAWEPTASPTTTSKTYFVEIDTSNDTETTGLALDVLPDETFGDYTATVIGRSEDDRHFRLDIRGGWSQTDGTVTEVDAPHNDAASEPSTGNPDGWDAKFDIATATPRVRLTGEDGVEIAWSILAAQQLVTKTATPPEAPEVPDGWVLRGYFKAPYAASPWEGSASAGDSDTRDATESLFAPDVSISPPDIADFNGTDQFLTLDGTVGDYLDATAYSGWALVFIDAIDTDSGTFYLNDHIFADDTGGYFGVCLQSTGPTVTAYHLDAVTYQGASTTCATGAWTLIQWRYDGTDVGVRVDSGSWQTTPAADIVGAGLSAGLKMGKQYSTSFFNGKVRNAGLLDTWKSDADFDDLVDAMNTLYGLSL